MRFQKVTLSYYAYTIPSVAEEGCKMANLDRLIHNYNEAEYSSGELGTCSYRARYHLELPSDLIIKEAEVNKKLQEKNINVTHNTDDDLEVLGEFVKMSMKEVVDDPTSRKLNN
jgi:hypothetical protein